MKSKFLRNQLVDSLSTNFLGLPKPSNATYGFVEMQVYFHSLISEHCSGNLGIELIHDLYGFNLPDQQTVSDRCEKLDVLEMEKQFNQLLLENALQLPTYRSDLNFAKVKNWNTEERRKVAENLDESKTRKRQRERGIEPPEGRWISGDFTLKPFYPRKKTYEEYIEEDHPIARYITKDRKKASSKVFFGYHTMYDHERGSRQILGMHMLRKNKKPGYKDGWKREGLHDVVQYLLDPILDRIDVAGFAGDGDYYNRRVIQYLMSKELDFVIRANSTPTTRRVIKEENLEEMEDGEGYELDGGITMRGRKKGEEDIELRLVIAKRGEELVELILPKYSELTPEQALLIFEERFGIETSYREVYSYLPKTSSVTPIYRLALYAITCWFFNLLLNYYQIVVIFSKSPKNWETSLARIKRHLDRILGNLLREAINKS